MREIAQYPSYILRTKTTPVPVGLDISALISDMREVCEHYKSVGLAANQVFSLRSVILLNGVVYINPTILNYLNGTVEEDEGSISVPTVMAPVRRAKKIRLDWLDENYQHHIGVFSGNDARCLQHFIDQLRGVLFIDRLNDVDKLAIKRQLLELQCQTD